MPAAPYYDHYPYEKLTDKTTADIARKQDHRITDLRWENLNLQNELHKLRQWRDKVLPILDANGLDVDEITNAMNATKGIFNGQRK